MHAHKKTIWIYPERNLALEKKISEEFGIHPVTAQVLLARGFAHLEDIHTFLYAKLPQLHAPDLLPDMDKAVKRILQAIDRKEKILIYADNDVDGMTGGALLTEFFQKIGINVLCYIPDINRLQISATNDAFTYAKKHGCHLVITVDCSIGAFPIDASYHIDLIITDHHELTRKVSHSVATLNPKLKRSVYPNRELTGVAVAFKLAHALLQVLIERNALVANDCDLKDFLDLVALGTIADMGALIGENRILVRYGLQVLKKNQRIGLKKLSEIAGLDAAKITPIDIALKIAPRLNSLGRIANPQKGVELLLTREEKQAEKLAIELDAYNTQRQKIEKIATEDVQKILALQQKHSTDSAIVLHSEKWHPGIVPIIASKIARKYHCPAMVIAIAGEIGKGSIRTISDFPLISVLKKQKKLLENFGGHDFAAGFTIKKEHIEEWKKQFILQANQTLANRNISKKLHVDANITFADITFDFLESLELLGPFGHGNPPPLFYTNAQQYKPAKIFGEMHLKVYLKQEERLFEGIGFGIAEKKEALSCLEEPLKVIFTPKINDFYDDVKIQLYIKDIAGIESLPE